MTERRKKDRRKGHTDYLMTDKQVAELAGVSIHTVKYWRLSGTLPFVKVGRHPKVWFSVFEKAFHKPDANGYWELAGDPGKIPSARDIRRKQ
jgi:hypothetical protein